MIRHIKPAPGTLTATRAHSLWGGLWYKDLAFAIWQVKNKRLQDEVSGDTFTHTGSTASTFPSGQIGTGVQVGALDCRYLLPSGIINGRSTKGFTVLSLLRPTAHPNYERWIFNLNTNPIVYIGLDNDNPVGKLGKVVAYSGVDDFWSPNATEIGQTYLLGLEYLYNHHMAIYWNGIQVASVGAAQAQCGSGDAEIALAGIYAGTGNVGAASVQFFGWWGWQRILSPAEHKLLATDPFGMFNPDHRTITSGYSKAHYSVKGVV